MQWEHNQDTDSNIHIHSKYEIFLHTIIFLIVHQFSLLMHADQKKIDFTAICWLSVQDLLQ